MIESNPLIKLLVRFLASCTVAYAGWRAMGLAGIVFSTPVCGALLAGPIIDCVGSVPGYSRFRFYRHVNGRHYAYQGKPIDVVEDDRGHRWLLLSDVRRILPDLPRDETLHALLGGGVVTLHPSSPRVQAEVLHEYLAKASTGSTGKFRIWLERTVVFPANQARARRDGLLQNDPAPQVSQRGEA